MRDLPPDETHPLQGLHGRKLNGWRLKLVWGHANPFGARYFSLFAVDNRGRASQMPLIIGLFNSGPEPGYNWIEIVSSSESVVFGPEEADTVAISMAILRRLIGLLARLLPKGGHFMIEYDSPHWLTTRQSLAAGVPPLATPLGSLIFDGGCGVYIRDWDLAEGGREGWRKLICYKAWDESHGRARAADNVRELADYLARAPRPGCEAVEKLARRKARRILKRLGGFELQPGEYPGQASLRH